MNIGSSIVSAVNVALRRRQDTPVQRSNRAARVMVDRLDAEMGVGPEWARRRYGDYYASSAAVHAAVKVRAEAVGRAPLVVLRRESPAPDAEFVPAGQDDPLQRLMDRPNPAWSRGEMWRATETYLLLWGSAYWGIESDASGMVIELWPLRPDRMRVLPDARRYVKGFMYEDAGEDVGYLPEEIAWFRHFNPLEEFSGLSSIAPARLAVDMGSEALRFNRNFFANSAMPGDVAITTEGVLTEEEVADFYQRWDDRYRGTARAHRPVLLGGGMDAKKLGTSQRDMDFVKGLEWSVEEVSRAFGVPKVFLSELEHATLANVATLERFLWRNTIAPELRLLEDVVNRSVAPLFDEFPGQRRVQFDLDAIESLRDSENDRIDRQVRLVQAGVVTVNEIRAEHSLPPVPWGDGPQQDAPAERLHTGGVRRWLN